MRHKVMAFLLPGLLAFTGGAAHSVQAPPATPARTSAAQALHVLNRLGFGPRPGDVERVQAMGVDAYIERQLHPERIDDSSADALVRELTLLQDRSADAPALPATPATTAAAATAREMLQRLGDNPSAAEADNIRRAVRETLNPDARQQQALQQLLSHRIIRAVHSERQLEEAMTDFWFNHFNVDSRKGAVRVLTVQYEMDAIRPHVLGNFKDLLLATARSPAMLFYLDNHLSATPNDPRRAARAAASPGARRTGINENYARELMELHTMGVDGGYTQQDIQEVARAFTGWTIDQPRTVGTFRFNPAMHDGGQKIVLGHVLPGGGIEDGERVIEILARHPSTARFISTKLVRRFVGDDPPAALVQRVAEVYTATGGDIRAMLQAIFSSEEFRSPEAYGQKTKSHFEFVVSAVRALGGDATAAQQFGRVIGAMGQPLYQYPAPTGYPDRADQWMSDGALLQRLNFAITLASGQFPNTRVELGGFPDARAAALFLGSPEFQRK